MMKVLEKGRDFASEVEIGSGVLWLPYKNILETVTRAIQDNGTEAFSELDSCAKKCKGDFVNFLNYRVGGILLLGFGAINMQLITHLCL